MIAKHRNTIKFLILSATALMILTALAYGHVQMSPRESAAGATEKYTMRVPNEKTVPNVRIEAEFPAAVLVTELEAKPGWKIEPKKDTSGRITGATWSGSSIAPREVAEFSFHARNPNEDTKLVWNVTQTYEDGSKSEWTGAEGSRSPAPVTTVRKSGVAKE